MYGGNFDTVALLREYKMYSVADTLLHADNGKNVVNKS